MGPINVNGIKFTYTAGHWYRTDTGNRIVEAEWIVHLNTIGAIDNEMKLFFMQGKLFDGETDTGRGEARGGEK